MISSPDSFVRVAVAAFFFAAVLSTPRAKALAQTDPAETQANPQDPPEGAAPEGSPEGSGLPGDPDDGAPSASDDPTAPDQRAAQGAGPGAPQRALPPATAPDSGPDTRPPPEVEGPRPVAPPEDEPAFDGVVDPTEYDAESEPDSGPSGRDIVVAYNTGFQWNIAPGIFFPSGGDPAFALSGMVGYGFDTGSVIVVPGVSAAAYFPTGTRILMALADTRVVLPIGHFAPFVRGGIGPGHITDPSHTGLALRGGGGFMVHFSMNFGLGVEALYQTITGTGFQGLMIGPVIALAF